MTAAELGPGAGVSLLVLRHRAMARHALVLWLLAIRWLRIGLAVVATTAGGLALG